MRTAIGAIASGTTVVASPDQVSCDLAGETVILSLTNATYYGLDAVGTFVWALLRERRTVAELRDEVSRVYAVEREDCERDLVDLLRDMAEHGLVEVIGANPS